jgi:hypothetical protein
MLLIVEPPGQRATRTRAEGEAAYAAMRAFGERLRERGQLVAVESLASHAQAARVQRQNGKTSVVDGPFAEAKEMVGGYFLLNTEDPAVALAWAERCPAAEWATVEIRGVGPCYT